jgi:hypothetical protein
MTDSVRARIPWLKLAFVLVVVLLTFANAALNLLPSPAMTARERQRAEQEAFVAERRARLAVLLSESDGCHPAIAHELAKALVFDGQSARAYADDYERRCGADPVVEHWARAPLPR